MGYYSTITPFSFYSELSLEDIKKAYIEFAYGLEGASDRAYMLSSDPPSTEPFYVFGVAEVFEVFDDGIHLPCYELVMEDYYAKHYADRRLAEFVSTVIAPCDDTTIEFDGEDGEKWGYLVLRDTVETIEYTRRVNGMDIDAYIKEYKEAHHA